MRTLAKLTQPATLEAESPVALALGLPQHPNLNEAALASRIADLESRLQFCMSGISAQLPSVRGLLDLNLVHHTPGKPYSYMVPYGRLGMNSHYLVGMGPRFQELLAAARSDAERTKLLELLPQVYDSGSQNWFNFTASVQNAVVGRLRELNTTLLPSLFQLTTSTYWQGQLKLQSTYQSAVDRREVMRKFKFWDDHHPDLDKALAQRNSVILHHEGQTYFIWTMDDPTQSHRQWALVMTIEEKPTQLTHLFDRWVAEIPPSLTHSSSIQVWTRDSIEQVWMTAENLNQLDIVPTDAFLKRIESDFAEFDQACAAVIGTRFAKDGSEFAQFFYETLESTLPELPDGEVGEYVLKELPFEGTAWTYTIRVGVSRATGHRPYRGYSVSMRLDHMAVNSGGTLGILYLDKGLHMDVPRCYAHVSSSERNRQIEFNDWYAQLSDRECAALKNYVVDVLVPRLQALVVAKDATPV